MTESHSSSVANLAKRLGVANDDSKPCSATAQGLATVATKFAIRS